MWAKLFFGSTYLDRSGGGTKSNGLLLDSAFRISWFDPFMDLHVAVDVGRKFFECGDNAALFSVCFVRVCVCVCV